MSAELVKFPEEVRKFAFDFAKQKEIAGGATLASPVTVTQRRLRGTGTLTLGAAAIVGKTVEFTISGGAAGDRFELKCVVNTSAAHTLAACGVLSIERIC